MNTSFSGPRHAAELERRAVVVLHGGRSSEREVSLKSGAGVVQALTQSQSPKLSHVYRAVIELDGQWTLDGKRLSPSEALARLSRETLFFLALHGGEGEDGRIQGFLELHGFTYTGSGVAASALCMNKAHTKAVLAAEGIATPKGVLIRAADWQRERAALEDRLAPWAAAGAVVKPNRGGSSVATFVLEPGTALGASIEAVLATGDDALVEERIVGVECTVGVLGGARGTCMALTPVEIMPKAGRFFDYEEKYSAQGAQEHCPPLHLNAEQCAELQALAERAHLAAGCEGYSRIDFLVPRLSEDRLGPALALEINTLPGMTERSLLPQAALVHGLSYTELCVEILARALERSRG